MNKEHWNTVIIDDAIPDALILTLIDDSYKLVVGKLSTKQRDRLTSD